MNIITKYNQLPGHKKLLVQGAKTATQKLLDKELAYSEDLQNKERITELKEHIEYLQDVIDGKCELSIFGRKGA